MTGSRLTSVETRDIRFPTSRLLDGSDAMHPDPDYSVAYLVLGTDAGDGHEGHGFAFTIGRGNDVQTAAIAALRPYLAGRPLEPLLADLGGIWRELVHDSQLRWLGPEKGVMHMAIAAVVNALWDLKAKRAGLPLWRLLSAMSPDELVSLVDFRYLTDAHHPGRGHGHPPRRPGRPGRPRAPHPRARLSRLHHHARLAGLRRRQAPPPLRAGGGRRVRPRSSSRSAPTSRPTSGACASPGRPAARTSASPSTPTSAGTWPPRSTGSASWHRSSPGGWRSRPAPTTWSAWPAIARAIAPVPVATGEHVQNRVVFKQLLQLEAISYLQLDAVRVAGVNENLAILLLAAKFGVPVCPHAGGVGLCELVQHLAMFDYVAVSGSMDDRVIEYVDHLHEHFVDPVEVSRGRYLAPSAPGFGSTMKPASLAEYAYPDGPVWNRTVP